MLPYINRKASMAEYLKYIFPLVHTLQLITTLQRRAVLGLM